MSVPPLRGLHDAGFDIALVVTGGDRRRGRGGATSPTPVKAAALELGLPVSHTVDDVLDVDADLGVVVAFGQIIRPDVLSHLDLVNVHYSLLPRWRGAAPVERAILAGDTETGVCLMKLEPTLDTGPVYRRVVVPMSPVVTADELRGELTDVAVPLLVNALRDGLGEPEPQVGVPVYAHKLEPDDFVLDFDQPAEVLLRVVRIGGATTTFRGRRFKVWSASLVGGHQGAAGSISGDIVATGRDGLRLLEVQPEGKPRRAASDWLNGARPDAADRLGAS
jgi:methionyl-tRNA formyltransferase